MMSANFILCSKQFCLAGPNERTVVMDKSKGEPVISVKTKSKERVSKQPCVNSHDRHYAQEPGVSFRSTCQTLLFPMFSLCSSRAQRVGTASHPARRRKTSCHSTRSRSRERGRGRDNERGRSGRWRGADTRKQEYELIIGFKNLK